jgi:hypothetical protein
MNFRKLTKKNKAQMFTLDIVFALIIIIFLIFLLSKISEIKTYKINTNNDLKELESIGNSTYKKLVSNPKINCYVYDLRNKFLLSNCLGSDSNITKDKLDFPNNYRCMITNLPPLITNECTDVPPVDLVNSYKIDFNISYFSNTRNIQKRNFDTNLFVGNLAFSDYLVTLEVWENE